MGFFEASLGGGTGEPFGETLGAITGADCECAVLLERVVSFILVLLATGEISTLDYSLCLVCDPDFGSRKPAKYRVLAHVLGSSVDCGIGHLIRSGTE